MASEAEVLKSGLQSLIADLQREVTTETGEWTVKGFIDVYRRIYSITTDTKVLSKILELTLFPILYDFARRGGFEVIPAEHQNHYPDLSLISGTGARFALDIKTTYRVSPEQVSGMTLGAFTGYFRDRASSKNVTFPYETYKAHLVLGVIYTSAEDIDESKSYSLDELSRIPSVAHDFEFFVQDKFRIATDRPGSGNTKNIGSVTNRLDLVDGEGPFTPLGERVFDDYWMYYLTADMARAAELPKPPYRNLAEYMSYRGFKR